VLELGCGNGANILPLAYYRPRSSFVGVDGARTAIALAEQRRADLDLRNLALVHADFLEAGAALQERFDFILAHGIFSWVSDETRDALFALCAARLRPGGLLYLNYNTRPGWDVRGIVRDFLLTQTARAEDLTSRTELARALAVSAAALFEAAEHPYSRLLANELRFVSQSHASYIAHEFLAPHNRAYWRWDFLELARRHGLEHVADADFDYPSGRVPADRPQLITDPRLLDRTPEDAFDLLSYRQLHSPIFTLAPWTRRPAGDEDLSELLVASCLDRIPSASTGNAMFRHPNGFEVEAKQDRMRDALEALRSLWPRGLSVAALLPGGGDLHADLRLLHLHGLIELRLPDAESSAAPPGPLNQRERAWGGYATTRYHTREA
jgi:SAM-dependent methyltransferase